MKRPRMRGRWPWLGLLLLPGLAWAVVLALVPTDCARARLVARLERATGRSVRIGALKLGVLGDLRILDLTIAEPRSAADPWLRAAEARLDVHLGQVLLGHCEPGEVVVDGLALRVWCRKDGTPEFGDLSRAAGPAAGGGEGRPGHGSAAGVAIRLRNATVRVVDEPSGTRFDLTEVEGRATFGRRAATLDELRGKLNGGTITLAAKLDRDPVTPRFRAEARVDGVEIDRGLAAIGTFVPVAAGATDGVGGKLTLRLAIDGRGASRGEIRRPLRGHGSVALDPIDLDGSRFLGQLEVLGDWPSESRVGAVTADFAIDRGRFTSEDLTIRVSRFPFVLAGWTDFDGRFDFAAKVDAIAAGLPREAQGLLGEFRGNLDDLSGLRLRGDRDRVDVTVHGRPLAGDPARPDGERARFREAARRVRDRFFR